MARRPFDASKGYSAHPVSLSALTRAGDSPHGCRFSGSSVSGPIARSPGLELKWPRGMSVS